MPCICRGGCHEPTSCKLAAAIMPGVLQLKLLGAVPNHSGGKMSANPAIHPRVHDAIARDQGIIEQFGLSVVSALDGRCEMVCVVPQRLVNAAGFAHGGVAFTLLDTACAYALSSTGVQGVTINANSTYVKAAQGGSQLQAIVKVMSQSRQLATLQGEVFLQNQGQSVLAAHGSFVFKVLND